MYITLLSYQTPRLFNTVALQNERQGQRQCLQAVGRRGIHCQGQRCHRRGENGEGAGPGTWPWSYHGMNTMLLYFLY